MTFKPIVVVLLSLVMLLSAGTAVAEGETATPLPPEPTLSTTPIVLTVNGTVASGTAGVAVQPGLSISLHVARISPGGSPPIEVLKREMALAADHTFRFENVTALPGDITFVTTTFEGVVQGSQLIPLANGQSSLTIPVTLYAATSDPGVITLIRVQHILDFRPGNVLQILATYDYKNTSDRLYLSTAKTESGQPVSVSVPLPIGVRAIAFNTQPAARFALGGDVNARVVQDTKAVLPGQLHEIVFSYQLPYTSGAAIDQDYPYNTTSLEILIPDDIKVEIDDAQFTRSANTAINPDRPFSQYVLKAPIPAGGRLIYTLSGAATLRPPTQTPSTNSSQTTGLALIAGVAILVTVVGLVAIRRTLRKRAYGSNDRRR